MTFSIVAYDPKNKEWGVAVQSKFVAVGAIVPFAQANIGAIATQAYCNTSYGPDGLELLGNGISADEVIELLTENDPNKDGYKFAIFDTQKNVATNYCIEATHELYPYWSPDDSQVMFLRPSHFSNSGKEQVILLDINLDLAVSIADGAQPFGWMISDEE